MFFLRNGKELKPSKNVTQTVKDDVCTLTVSDSKEADTGEYKCVAKNPKGTVEHTSKVTVQSKWMNPYLFIFSIHYGFL